MQSETALVSKDVGDRESCLDIQVETRLTLSDAFSKRIQEVFSKEGMTLNQVVFERVLEEIQLVVRTSFLKGRDFERQIVHLTS